MGTFSSSHLARMGQYLGSSRHESPKLEWVFQPLKPSSLTQRSSSLTAWSTSLGASVAHPPKRSGCLAMASARTLLASSATLTPTSAGKGLDSGRGVREVGEVDLGLVHGGDPTFAHIHDLFLLGDRAPHFRREPLATVLQARIPLVIGQSLQPGLGDEVVLQVDSRHSGCSLEDREKPPLGCFLGLARVAHAPRVQPSAS